MQGRVIQSTGSWYQVDLENGNAIASRLPGRFRLSKEDVTNPVAVGDLVEITVLDDGTGRIDGIHERMNEIAREATHGRKGKQIIAANIDSAFVIQAVKKPVYKTGFIDRFLVTCEFYRIMPFILMNKMDLAGENELEKIQQIETLYEELGYSFITCSIFDESSISLIRKNLKGKISLFSGPSGVGKTSLLNKIHPGLEKPVADVSGFSNKGRHTTTFSELIALPEGGYLIDTPGIREFGIVDIDPQDICHYFPEIRERMQECKYYNCTHIHEPGCAILQAVNEGKIAQSRYRSYKNIMLSLKSGQKDH